MRKIRMSPMDSLSQVLSPDRDEPLRLLHCIVFSDILEFEGHPVLLLALAFPDPNPLPSLLVLDIGFDLLSREEDRVAEGLEEREGVVADDDPFDRRLSGVAG